MSEIKLTQYSRGAGCGCKIAPALLERMLQSQFNPFPDQRLVVGNNSRDDAAVVDLGDGTGIISTTDFFMPIVDDSFDFGRISATNAISDIYAMGGEPLVAIAILGWPVSKLGPDIVAQVLDGARTVCASARISLAGGHSIETSEPIFGLAVTGRCRLNQLKRNDQAHSGDRLLLTKPLGVGILTTAEKQSKLRPEHATLALDSMCQLNDLGTKLAGEAGVHAMTDVTGFGLLGHVLEMCQGSHLGAELWFEKIPLLTDLQPYLQQGCIPGGCQRNFASYGHRVAPISDNQRHILCDPQTSGGLLIAVVADRIAAVEALCAEHGQISHQIGYLSESTVSVTVI
jgi:selenide,water dikinase